MKCVGILGGTGEIGKRVLNILNTEYPIIASYHSRQQKSKENCKYVKLDVSDRVAVKEFCRQCDIIVNCAGASYINGEFVARIATELNIPYIDPSGETFLEERISDIEGNNIFVLSSGYFPGMTGILISYLCESFDSIQEISGLSVSEEIPSKSAIEDFILTNLSGFGVSLSYYDDGNIKRDEREIFEIIKSKEYRFENYLTIEVEKLAKKFGVKKANWYNCTFGKEITEKMQEAVIGLKISKEKNHCEDVINEIREIFKKNFDMNRAFTYIRIWGKGILDGKETYRNAEISSKCSSEISAIVAAYTVKAVLQSNLDKGIYYAMDIINNEEILKDLQKFNVDFSISEVNEQIGDDEYEEGIL